MRAALVFARQLLQAEEPFRQSPASGNPPSGLPHQRTALSLRETKKVYLLSSRLVINPHSIVRTISLGGYEGMGMIL